MFRKFFLFLGCVTEILKFPKRDAQNFSNFRNVFRKFSNFPNVFQNFSDFQNVFRNFSGFSERILENFHFTKWNNSKICTGNGNRNSCFWIHISGSFRFHYGNFDPKYLESLLGTQMKHTALKNLICTGAKVRGSERLS